MSSSQEAVLRAIKPGHVCTMSYIHAKTGLGTENIKTACRKLEVWGDAVTMPLMDIDAKGHAVIRVVVRKV